ncbi:MAG: restriction endonuclease [Planctomycetota bacterium]
MTEQLFVWRDKEESALQLKKHCPFCGRHFPEYWVQLESLDERRNRRDEASGPYVVFPAMLSRYEGEYAYRLSCQRCGYYAYELNHYDWNKYAGPVWGTPYQATLRAFDANDTSVELEELGTYLKERHKLLSAIGWRRFEELVCDIFKHHGWDAQLTLPSKDGGADVILFQNGERTAIVECKKYSSRRKVGVGMVRQLVGASVRFDVRNAHIVTSSSFTSGAEKAARDYVDDGFTIDLHAASDLFQLLAVYNANLPRLPEISAADAYDLWPTSSDRR